jgi:hypothetical protein
MPICFFLATMLAAVSAQAQGTFQNLNFEAATPGAPITGPIIGADYQPLGLALPGWTAYIGAEQQSEVLQNDYTLGQASVDLFGPNYPAAGPSPGPTPGTIDGNYSVLLQAGGEPGNSSVTVGASIAQTGMVPPSSQSLAFKAWQTFFTTFSVSFNGNNLSPVVLGAGANYTLYGVNISPYDGQTGSLEFTADFSGTGASWLGLDDISFSPQSIPEPSPLALTGVGALLFALCRRFAPKWP